MESRGKLAVTEESILQTWKLTGQTEYITTPPLPPSSSPVPLSDLMEMTPSLPHKNVQVAQIEIESPTPVQSPADEMMLDSPLEPKPAVAE
jgi:hypothetical protein